MKDAKNDGHESMNNYQKQLIRLEIIMPGIRESDRGEIMKCYEYRDYIGMSDAVMNALDRIYGRSTDKIERRK